MSRLLLNLRNVPDDEVLEIRALLDEHGLAYFETEPSRWGISMGGIWLHDESDYETARRLLDGYQQSRKERMQAAHREARASGRAETLWRRLRRRPVEMLVYLAVAALILVLSTKPFLDLIGD